MRVLAGWDEDRELELLSLYLEVDGNHVQLVRSPEEFLEHLKRSSYDVALFPITFPDVDRSFQLFEMARQSHPHLPLLVASRPGEVYPLSRFIRCGLRSYVYRDPQGDYLFLLQTLLQSTLEAKRAEDVRILADRLGEEIDSVRKLQESIIPKHIHAPKGYDIAAKYEPSQIQVQGSRPVVLAGGDYYYTCQLADGRTVFLVGDASGHGMKACMSIMSLHTLVQQLQSNLIRPPHECVENINRQLCTHDVVQSQEGFITLLYGILDEGVMHWTSAGHCLPIVQNLSTGEIYELGTNGDGSGFPLAIVEEADYVTVQSEIPPNHRLVIYTDGLVEAFDQGDQHNDFGVRGVKETLTRCARLSADETVNSLFADSYSFTGGQGRHDDTSVLVIDRK